MGAIVKTINIHGDNLKPLLDYGKDEEKTSLEANDLENLLSYASNPEKTTIQLPQEGEQSLLVSGVLCNPNTANEEFAQLRNRHRENNPEYLPSFDFLNNKTKQSKNVQKHPVTAIHVIQSFDGKDIDPRIAHQIGIELLERLGVQGVCDTHMNTDHFHNHLVINAYMPDGMTKFYMNNEKRIELRRLSDEIQREYGLEISFLDPEQQQKIAQRSLNYKEWSAQREGLSWKEKMRGDIAVAREIADDKDEFIEVMKDYGYAIEKQKGKDSIMWLNTDNGRTIWDSTLGQEYMLCSLFPDETPEHEMIVETDRSRKQTYRQTVPVISVAKYDYSGRRRTEIELLIRRTIAIIQRVSNFINRQRNGKTQKYNAKAKLDMMQEALATLKEFGIETADDLNNKLDLAGKNLSMAKSAVSRVNGEMQYYSVVERVIAEYQDAKTLYDSVKFWTKPHDLHLNQFSQRDISLGIAQIAPLSQKQKTELFQMLNGRPNLRLVDAGKGYCNISAIQFRQIKDYFKGVGERPDCLAEMSDTAASFAYERQYQFLSSKITYEPTKVQRDKAKNLLEEHGFGYVNADKLTMADIINIDNCWGECPFSSPLITEDKQQLLQVKLQAAGKTVNRDISQIMEREYNQIISFLDGHSKKMPPVMKDTMPPSETDLQKTQKLAVTLGFSPSVDMSSMTREDVRDFYNWLVSQGREPMCTNITNPATWEQNKDIFHSDIECETPRKQEVLIGLRNATNTLAQLGIAPEDIPQFLTHIEELKAEQKDLKETQTEFADQYKQLLRLKQQTSHAKDKTFLFGALFDESEIKSLEEDMQKQEQAQERDSEPEPKTEEEKEKEAKTLTIINKLTRKPHILDNDLDL